MLNWRGVRHHPCPQSHTMLGIILTVRHPLPHFKIIHHRKWKIHLHGHGGEEAGLPVDLIEVIGGVVRKAIASKAVGSGEGVEGEIERMDGVEEEEDHLVADGQIERKTMRIRMKETTQQYMLSPQ